MIFERTRERAMSSGTLKSKAVSAMVTTASLDRPDVEYIVVHTMSAMDVGSESSSLPYWHWAHQINPDHAVGLEVPVRGYGLTYRYGRMLIRKVGTCIVQTRRGSGKTRRSCVANGRRWRSRTTSTRPLLTQCFCSAPGHAAEQDLPRM